jgi:hypothetical protein
MEVGYKRTSKTSSLRFAKQGLAGQYLMLGRKKSYAEPVEV